MGEDISVCTSVWVTTHGAGELLARGLASRDERNAGDDVVGNRAGRS